MQAWISNYTKYEVLMKLITTAVETSKWISNFIIYCNKRVVTFHAGINANPRG